jgi:hypothetical protein
MKKSIKRTLYSTFLGLVAASVMSGCGETTSSSGFDTVSSGSSSGTTSGSDTLNVIKKSDDRVVFQWKKRYRGYSEVLNRQNGITGRRGYFMTQNATGDYELECTITDRGYNTISWGCVSTGSGYLASNANLGYMLHDKYYNLVLSLGVEHTEIDTGIYLYYDSDSKSIEVIK